jgi:hypothetical protein
MGETQRPPVFCNPRQSLPRQVLRQGA